MPSTSHTPTAIPLPPSFAALPIPERMVRVMRERRMQGQPTTLDDFLQASETCDLSEAQLAANIGAAKRLIHPETVRHDQPARPRDPWDFDRDYRKSRVQLAAGMLAGAMPTEAEVHAILRQGDRFTARELGALWPEIIAAAGDLFHETRGGH